MSASLITSALTKSFAGRISLDGWVADQTTRGEKVALYRRYADGDHDGDLTAEMRKQLRISDRPGSTTPFSINRLNNVIQTPVDRLNVKRIEDTGGTANDWVKQVLQDNRFDGLQVNVHEAAIRDGDTFVLVDFDEDKKRVRFTHESAYDGIAGMLVLYEKQNQSEITAAVKVWHVTSAGGSIADTMRVNVYYPDRCEKFVSQNGGTQLVPFTDKSTDANGVARWTDQSGAPLGVPVVHFKNQPQAHDNYGRSHIDDAIAPQDAINRLMHSMVATAELSGFPIRVAKGFNPPGGLTPGMWVVINAAGMAKEDVGDASLLPGSPLDPFLSGMQFLIRQIDETTRTPNSENMGSSAASGEALKQREAGLVGMVKRCQIGFGNSWEDVMVKAHRIGLAFAVSEKPPAVETFVTQWGSAEVRNIGEEVKNVLLVADRIGEEQTIRELAKVFDWDEDKIQDILDKKQQEADRKLQAAMQSVQRFNMPPNGNGNANGGPMMTNRQAQMNNGGTG